MFVNDGILDTTRLRGVLGMLAFGWCSWKEVKEKGG